MGARRFRVPFTALLVAGIATAVVAPSCSDPVHDQEVQALGPEDPQIPKGEYHRAGQPCAVCHGPEGPAKTTFGVAGTIFWNPLEGAAGVTTGVVGANNATVSVVDSLGSQQEISTNCVGNFWVTSDLYDPAFPILVRVFTPEGVESPPMFSQISRSESCATCHSDPPNYNAVGHVYLTTGNPPQGDLMTNAANCPVVPDLSQQGGGIP